MRRSFLLISFAALAFSAAARADVSISNKPTQNMSCNAGVCVPTAKNAVLNVGDLTNMLAAGDLTLQSGNGDGTAAGITIADGFSWANTSRLTLNAKKNITIRTPVVVAGTGALAVRYNQGNVGGDLLFEKKGKIDFWDVNSSLTINDQSYALVASIKQLKDRIHNTEHGHYGAYALTIDYDAGPDGAYRRAVVHTFHGAFEGLGHTISNLAISQGYGFFAHNSGTIRDLALAQALIDGRTNYPVGGLVGTNSGSLIGDAVHAVFTRRNVIIAGGLVGNGGGRIVRCTTSGTVIGKTVGGLAGESGGSIQNSTSAAEVISTATDLGNPAGGLVGENVGSITKSHATGHVQAVNYAGGLVGFNTRDASIIASSASGDVSAPDLAAGGLVANNAGTIAQSFATGDVSGTEVGGLIGDALNNESKIVDSYARGNATGESAAGGLAGSMYEMSAISTSYSIGSVKGQSYAGGLLGFNVGEISTSDYWDLDTSGISDPSKGCGNISNCPGLTGLTDAQLKSALPAGFDSNIWGQDPNINNGYPYLRANPPR
jgi:hypothetical protein